MRIDELQRWFKDHVTYNDKPYVLNEEQARVVLDAHKNAIVTARAGSGKTYTLIAKIIYLIVVKEIDPAHILALGFNHNPQKDFRKRLTKVFVDGKQIIDEETSNNLARTFHSFAMEMSKKPQGQILFDNPKEREKQARTKYIDKIVEKIIDSKAIYNFIRDDSYEPSRSDYKTDEDYYLATKYQKFETLGGETVRSRGEKIIADFLFEHGIAYEYERAYYPKSLKEFANLSGEQEKLAEHEKIYCDFYLPDFGIVWEHWGITGNETDQEIKDINNSGAIGEYEEYDENKSFKEWFYDGSWLNQQAVFSVERKASLDVFLDIKDCIYTNYQRGISREEFEYEIAEVLKSHGIDPTKLPEDILIAKFKDTNNIQNTSKRVARFIDRAEQQFPDNFDGLKAACFKEKTPQTKLFYEVALSAYNFYLSEINSPESEYGYRQLLDQLYYPRIIYSDDYSIAMSRAAKDIADYKENPNAKIKIDELEYIFLDEYQDFSLLFLNLITAVVNRVPNIKVLAVGDDWQAINGYTGASLEYFENFEKYFPNDVTRMRLSTNYRSVFSIVDAANRFMSNSLNDDNGAVSNKPDTDDNILNSCTLDNIRKFYPDEDHKFAQDYRRRYDLLLTEIVHDNRGKSIKFLNRTNDIRFEKGDSEIIESFGKEFKRKLEQRLKISTDEISFSTVNTAKGLEADVVVLLESDTGRFPIFHPDNHLYKVFGENEQKSLDEQKRLFYVAITRPKEKLYIIHNFNKSLDNNSGQQSKDRDFLDMLEIDQFDSYQKDTFTPLQKLLEAKKRDRFNAKKIKITKNKYDSNYVDIIVTSTDNQIVRRNKAFSDDESSRQMRDAMFRCSKEKPVPIRVTVDERYSRPYIKLYVNDSY